MMVQQNLKYNESQRIVENIYTFVVTTQSHTRRVRIEEDDEIMKQRENFFLLILLMGFSGK